MATHFRIEKHYARNRVIPEVVEEKNENGNVSTIEISESSFGRSIILVNGRNQKRVHLLIIKIILYIEDLILKTLQPILGF